MSSYDENKVVSIEFDNQQFERDVQKTINTINALDEATSGKNLKGDGISGLEKAFSDLSKNATSDIDQINGKLSDTKAYDNLSNSISEVNNDFSTLQIIGIGALLAIGETAVSVGAQIANTVTSGIRDGWSEYNLIMDSTQTILANTQRYGTTLDDVTGALDILNEYADRTIYNFSQMTRNIGLFTTAGMNLEDSVVAIKGMANLGAVFGADNAAMARATYQMSQAMSSGFVKLRDWMSMENAGMGGKILQEELIRTAAIMSGQSVDAFKEYINYSKGFRNTLEYNWLTADVFMETMRKYAGESREYWESLKDASGNRLYTDEEIDDLMEMAAAAEEAATKVRTFRMMMEALLESIGSGWSTTFRLLIGDLNEAKEFWTPINDLLSGIVNGVSDYRNTLIKSWRDIYRSIAIEDLMKSLDNIRKIMEAIGKGIAIAFGSTHQMAGNIGRVTEAFGDLATTLSPTEEELEAITSLVSGLLSPFTLIGDLIYELSRTFFNASDALNEFDTRGQSLADKMQGFRSIFASIIDKIGNFLRHITNAIRESGVITRAVNLFADAFKKVYDLLYRFTLWVIPVLENLINNYIFPFIGLFVELAAVSWLWLRNLVNELSSMNLNLLEDFKNIFNGLYDIFVALIDPTKDVADALANFRDILANTSIAGAIDLIRNSLNELWNSLKNTHLFQFFINAIEQFKQTEVGTFLFDTIEKLKNVVSTVMGSFSGFSANGGFLGVIQSIIDYLIPLKEKIQDLGLVDSAIVILKSIFSTIGDLISSVVTGLSANVGGLDFESNLEEVAHRIIRAVEILMIIGTVLAVANLPKLFGKTVENLAFQVLDPIGDMIMVIKERFKRDTWQVMADFFKSLAIFVGVMAAAIMIMASLKDPYIAMPLLITMFAGIAIIIGVITSSINTMFTTIKAGGMTNLLQMVSVVFVLQQMSVILGQITTLLGMIAAIAYLYSKTEDKSSIAIAFGALIGTFTLIASMMLLLLEKMSSSFITMGAMSTGLKASMSMFTAMLGTITSILVILTLASIALMKFSDGDVNLLMGSVLSLIAAIGVIGLLASYLMDKAKSMLFVNKESVLGIMAFVMLLGNIALTLSIGIGIIAKLGGDAGTIMSSAISLVVVVGAFSMIAVKLAEFSTRLNAIQFGSIAKISSLITLLSVLSIVFSLAIKLIAKEDPDRVFAAILAVAAITGVFSVLAIKIGEFSSALAAASTGNIAKMAVTMVTMIASLFAILRAMDKLGTMMKDLGTDTIWETIKVIAAIFSGMLVLMGLISAMKNYGLMDTRTILAVSASMLLLSTSLLPIASSITLISALSDVNSDGAIKAAKSIAIVIASMAGALAIIPAVWKVLSADIATIAVATVAFIALAHSLVIIAGALAIMGSIPDVSNAVSSMLNIVWSLTAILGIFGVLGAISEGIGPAILLAVAGAFAAMAGALVLVGLAVEKMGEGMLNAGTGMNLFATSMETIQNLNTDKLLNGLKAIAGFLPLMAGMIMANKVAIIGAIITVFEGVGAGISAAIRIILRTIGSLLVEGAAEHIRIIADLVVQIFDIVMNMIHSCAVILNEFLKKEIGPGGVFRQLAVTLGDFIIWLGSFLGTFMLTLATTVIESLAEAFENEGLINRLFMAIKHLILSVKLSLYTWLGVASLGEWAAQMVIGFFGGLIDSWLSGMEEFTNGINDLIERATGERIESLDAFANQMSSTGNGILISVGSLVNDFQTASISEVQSELDALNAQAQALDDTLAAEEARRRAIEAEGDTSVYNPSRYYAAAAGVEDWNNQLSETPTLLGSITDLLGGGSFTDLIGSWFGGDSSTSSWSNLLDTDSLFTSSGEDAGTSWSNGFSNAISSDTGALNTMSSMDFSNIEELSNVDFTNFNTGLSIASSGLDDISSPVITPIMDTSEIASGIGDIESMWNNSDIDTFAIDAGRSVLTSQRTNGDASTDGNVTVSFTQNNYSPEALSPTQLYRDGNNLLRGRVGNMGSYALSNILGN